MRGALALDNVSFRYGDNDPFIFTNLTFAVAPGECVAIAGPSGCGKTTMMKVMLGLLPPTGGQVLIDGQPLHSFGIQAYRRIATAVMQDDQLMSGSIADNIAFFDPRPTSSGSRSARPLPQSMPTSCACRWDTTR